MRLQQRVVGSVLVPALVGAILLLSPFGIALEQGLGLSWLFNLRGPVQAPASALVIDIDANSAVRLNQPSKLRDWDRSLHAELIRKLQARGATAIVFDIFFDSSDAIQSGDKFATAIGESGRVILVQRVQRDQVGDLMVDRLLFPTEDITSSAIGLAPFPLPKVRNRFGQFWAFYTGVSYTPTLPVTALQVLVLRTYGYDRFVDILVSSGLPDADRLPVKIDNASELHELMELVRSGFLSSRDLLANVRARIHRDGSDSITNSEAALLALLRTYDGPDSYFLNFYGPPETIETIPYEAFWDSSELQEAAGISDLSGRVVFVGGASKTTGDQIDGFFTVFTGSDEVDIAGVEIAATAFDNLLRNRTLHATGTLINLFIVLIVGGLGGLIAYRTVGILAVPYTLAVFVAYAAISAYLFIAASVWVATVIPVAIQFPIALLYGYLTKYLTAKRARDKYSETIRYYVPERVAKDFDRGRDPHTEPELVYGVCLSTDINGYTTLAEQIPEAELATLTNEYFEALGRCVSNRDGEMLEVRGDSMNCVWSAKQFEKDLACQAAVAAIDILDCVDAFNERHADRQLPTRIGMHAGRVAIGNIGGGGRLAFSVMGDSINTASRIQELNKVIGTRLLATDTVIQELSDCAYRRICSFQPKGKAEILSIYEILGLRGSATDAANKLCSRFDAAIVSFESRDWAGARQLFDDLLLAFPGDGPSRFYSARCRRYLESPPQQGEETLIRSNGMA